MAIVARAVFGIVNWAARKGLAEEVGAGAAGAGARDIHARDAARQTGVRGETFAYWYLRRRGYTIIARNFMVPGMKGEIDLAGYDGGVLAFVEVKTRTIADDKDKSGARPEEAVTRDKRRHLVRMAQQFLAEWRIKEAQCRFDVLAIESRAGAAPVVRLHKDAFGSSAGE
jgi:putative endonuclease